MAGLNLCSTANDGTMITIRRRLARAIPVAGRDDFRRTVAELAASGARAGDGTLDLIGHARAPLRALALGGWLLADDSVTRDTFAACRPALLALGVSRVRLLGCHTASTAGGRRLIQDLAQLLEVEVWGATAGLGSEHYDAAGLVRAQVYRLSRATSSTAQRRPSP